MRIGEIVAFQSGAKGKSRVKSGEGKVVSVAEDKVCVRDADGRFHNISKTHVATLILRNLHRDN